MLPPGFKGSPQAWGTGMHGGQLVAGRQGTFSCARRAMVRKESPGHGIFWGQEGTGVIYR